MRKTFPGFTLFEMAIVLIIVGIVGGLTFPLLNALLAHQKESKTHDHQEKILFALAAYVNQNGKLPSPASGDGIINPAKCTGNHCQGYVPYTTLGLAEAMAKDGHQRWFIYVTDKRLTTTHVLQTQPGAAGVNLSFCTAVTQIDLTDGEQLAPGDRWAVLLVRTDAEGNPPQEFSLQNSQAVTRNNLMAIYGRNPCRGQHG